MLFNMEAVGQAGESSQNFEKRIVAVMGVTGAGQIYLTQHVTGSTTIRVGRGLESGEFVTFFPFLCTKIS